MPNLQFSAWMNSSPETIYQVLTDLNQYTSWLPVSNLYRETKTISDTTLQVGTTYVDSVIMHGEVTELDPYFHVAFRQVGLRNMLGIRIRYTLEPKENGTQVHREITISIKGVMRLFQPLLIRSISRENDRIMEQLKRYVETR